MAPIGGASVPVAVKVVVALPWLLVPGSGQSHENQGHCKRCLTMSLASAHQGGNYPVCMDCCMKPSFLVGKRPFALAPTADMVCRLPQVEIIRSDSHGTSPNRPDLVQQSAQTGVVPPPSIPRQRCTAKRLVCWCCQPLTGLHKHPISTSRPPSLLNPSIACIAAQKNFSLLHRLQITRYASLQPLPVPLPASHHRLARLPTPLAPSSHQ